MKWLSIILGISKTHLFSRIKQSSVAALGVTFGIGAYIILMSFMTGLNAMLDGLVTNRTPHIHIYNEIKPSTDQPSILYEGLKGNMNVISSIKPKNTPIKIHNALPIMNHLKKDGRVKGITPQVKAQVFYLGGAIELNGMISGVDPLMEAKLFNFDDYLIDGTARSLKNNINGILMGIGAANKLSLKIGDKVQLATSKGEIIPLKIVGFYQSGLAEVDNIQSYVNLSTAQRILGENKSYITDVNLKLYTIEKSFTMSKEISKQFGITAVDINTANAQFETGSDIRNLISYAVSITLLIVAGFGIYNILNMMIYEKMNDIAILKATGFSGFDVKVIFISQAMIIGLIGGIIGLAVGYGVSVLIDSAPFETEALPTIKTYPVNFDPMFYIIGIIFAIVSTFLAGYLPARKAQKIDPVDIIRGQ